jgi:hypothetical protein
LDEDTVNGGIVVEFGNALEELGFRDVFGVIVYFAFDIGLLLLAN